MNPYYTDFAEYMTRFFGARKVQKLSVNLSAGCPNRDGTIGTGGCIYCNNSSFTPAYCFANQSITEQLEAGRKFFGRKYTDMAFLAYFQSFTSTHGTTVREFAAKIDEAMASPDMAGLVIGTRPDCIADELADLLQDYNSRFPVFVELGVESMCDDTLRLINRGHGSDVTKETICRLAARGLHVGVHLIAGLPNEDDERVLRTVDEICALPVESIKLHHLQVLRGTKLEQMVRNEEVKLRQYTPESYADLCVKILQHVPRRIAVERFLASAPPEMVISPRWGLKNYQFTNLLLNKLMNNE